MSNTSKRRRTYSSFLELDGGGPLIAGGVYNDSGTYYPVICTSTDGENFKIIRSFPEYGGTDIREKVPYIIKCNPNISSDHKYLVLFGSRYDFIALGLNSFTGEATELTTGNYEYAWYFSSMSSYLNDNTGVSYLDKDNQVSEFTYGISKSYWNIPSSLKGELKINKVFQSIHGSYSIINGVLYSTTQNSFELNYPRTFRYQRTTKTLNEMISSLTEESVGFHRTPELDMTDEFYNEIKGKSLSTYHYLINDDNELIVYGSYYINATETTPAKYKLFYVNLTTNKAGWAINSPIRLYGGGNYTYYKYDGVEYLLSEYGSTGDFNYELIDITNDQVIEIPNSDRLGHDYNKGTQLGPYVFQDVSGSNNYKNSLIRMNLVDRTPEYVIMPDSNLILRWTENMSKLGFSLDELS